MKTKILKIRYRWTREGIVLMTSPNTDPQEDPFSKVKHEPRALGELTAREVNALHRRSDVDSKATAQHHSLGVQRNQASPGDHIHDGKASKLAGSGLNLSISGTKNTAASEDSIVAMLKKVISFTDGRT